MKTKEAKQIIESEFGDLKKEDRSQYDTLVALLVKYGADNSRPMDAEVIMNCGGKNKVIMEVTEKGHTTTLILNGKKYVEEWEETKTGAKCVKGNFENEDDIPEELYYALDSRDPFDIMQELATISE